MDLDDEPNWLRPRIIRLRTALRFTEEPRVETILREFIADAEERLSALDHHDGSVHRPVKPPKAPN
jgi:hypothetical protein